MVLEFALDCTRIDIRRNDNPWLNRAALSLAEVIRLAASKALDMEFTELVTGYRLRENAKGFFVDIYLYDSLSGGAGYADSIAGEIEWLLEEVEVLLQSCDCGSSCYKCLKQKKILVYPTMWWKLWKSLSRLFGIVESFPGGRKPYPDGILKKIILYKRVPRGAFGHRRQPSGCGCF